MSDGEKRVSRRILLAAGASTLAGLAGCGGSGGGSEPGTVTGESTATPTATSTPTETSRPGYGLSDLGVFEEEYRGMLDAAIMGNFDVPDGKVAAAQEAYLNGDPEAAIRTIATETMKRSAIGSKPAYRSLEGYRSTAGVQAARNIVTYLGQGRKPGETRDDDFSKETRTLDGETAEGFQPPETPGQHLALDPEGPNLSGIADVKRVFIGGQLADILTFDHHGGGDYVGLSHGSEATVHRLGTKPQTEMEQNLAGLAMPRDLANGAVHDHESNVYMRENVDNLNIKRNTKSIAQVLGDVVVGPQASHKRSGWNPEGTPAPNVELLLTMEGFEELSGGAGRFGLTNYDIQAASENVLLENNDPSEVYIMGEEYQIVTVDYDFSRGVPESLESV